MGSFKLTDEYMRRYNQRREGKLTGHEAPSARNRSFEDVARMLTSYGFQLDKDRGHGSHAVFKHPGARFDPSVAEALGRPGGFMPVLTVPRHDTLHTGTMNAIISDATFILRCVPGNEGVAEADLRGRL